jgi:hypothetical protein
MADETQGIDPYEVVLADLKARRDQIDQTIASIESLRSGTGGNASSTLTGIAAKAGTGEIRGTNQGDINGPGGLLGLSIVDAAKALLKSKRTPLKNPEIAALFKAGGMVMNSKEPANTIGSVLTRRFSEVGDVVRVGRGIWGLKEWYPNRSFKKDTKESAKEGLFSEARPEAAAEPEIPERRRRGRPPGKVKSEEAAN